LDVAGPRVRGGWGTAIEDANGRRWHPDACRVKECQGTGPRALDPGHWHMKQSHNKGGKTQWLYE